MQKERLKSNKLELRNHLSASLFQGCSLKIHPQTSFDPNGLKNGSSILKVTLKSMHLFQRLMGAMNCRYRSQKNQTSSAVRSEQSNGNTIEVIFFAGNSPWQFFSGCPAAASLTDSKVPA